MAPRHVILSALGTDGDIFPYVGLGAALRARGHRVTLAAAEDYRPLAHAQGFAFRPLATAEENAELIGHPDFWHPLKGARVGARWGVRFLDAHYDLFSDLASKGDAVVVASPALLAARVAHEKLGFPIANLILQPWMIRSSTAPPVMPAGLTLPRWAPRPLARLYWRGVDVAGLLLMGRELNALRHRVGLPPVRHVFDWWLSPQRVLGMFPPWFGPPQDDWPPQVRLTGFPRYDGSPPRAPAGPDSSETKGSSPPLPTDLLAFCREGTSPPVAVTFGTGMRHAARLFAAAGDACRITNRRAIFLTRHADQLPADLPPTIRHVPFAPFRALFPECAAVVHHGGIGTVAEALAAGTPQVTLAIAFDQKDNALRLKRLGAGDWMRASRATGPRLARALEVVTTPAARETCARIARQFDRENPLERAADEIERLVPPA